MVHSGGLNWTIFLDKTPPNCRWTYRKYVVLSMLYFLPSLDTQSCIKGLLVVRDFCFWAVALSYCKTGYLDWGCQAICLECQALITNQTQGSCQSVIRFLDFAKNALVSNGINGINAFIFYFHVYQDITSLTTLISCWLFGRSNNYEIDLKGKFHSITYYHF